MPSDLKPYRVEWHPDLVTGWVLIRSLDSHDEARAEAAASRKKWGGQTRIVAQHVIERAGLGA